MQEAELLLYSPFEETPILTGRLQKRESSEDICLDKGFRGVDRAIDMAFRCKINNCRRAILVKQFERQI